MSRIVLDGKKLANEMEAQLANRVQGFLPKTGGKAPTLATVLVGGRPRFSRVRAHEAERLPTNWHAVPARRVAAGDWHRGTPRDN